MDWNALDEVEAWELVLRSALQSRVGGITIARDNRGASIFFTEGERLETFDHLPAPAIDRMARYLKRMAAIDPYKCAPQEGLSVVELDEAQYTLTVRTVKGSVGEDLEIRVGTL